MYVVGGLQFCHVDGYLRSAYLYLVVRSTVYTTNEQTDLHTYLLTYRNKSYIALLTQLFYSVTTSKLTPPLFLMYFKRLESTYVRHLSKILLSYYYSVLCIKYHENQRWSSFWKDHSGPPKYIFLRQMDNYLLYIWPIQQFQFHTAVRYHHYIHER